MALAARARHEVAGLRGAMSQIPTLHFIGPAKLVHINARKEGPEDDKVLACDLKFALTASNDLLISFHPQLRMMLFTKEGEPRFPLMGPVDWDYEFRQMRLSIDPLNLDPEQHYDGVKLKKWLFAPKKGGLVDVSFQAQLNPDRNQFGIIGRMLIAESVRIYVRSANGDLFENVPGPGAILHAHVEAAGKAELEPGPVTKAAPPQEESTTRDLSAPEATPPQSPATAAAPEDHDNVVPAFNGAGIPLGFRLDKRQHPAGSTVEQGGIVYDVIGQGAGKITLSAQPPKKKDKPSPIKVDVGDELTEELKKGVYFAGAAEASKHEDDRDFEGGRTAAYTALGLSRAFVEENLAELEGAYLEGWESIPVE
jgi:hypothetical protein